LLTHEDDGMMGQFLVTSPTDVREENSSLLPIDFSLDQNYPNPFNPETVIGFHLSIAGHVTLKVFDFLGKEVATLVDGFMPAGSYRSSFSALHSSLSSGVYLYQLKAGQFVSTKKSLFLK
jgi:hypothetical protein